MHHTIQFDDEGADLMDEAWAALEEKVRGVRFQIRRGVLIARERERLAAEAAKKR